MANLHHTFEVDTPAAPIFIDVTERMLSFLSGSGIRTGTVLVYSQHTSCCVIMQEESEDVTYAGMQYILRDTLNALQKIVPPCTQEGQYLHPGPIHIQNAKELRDEQAAWGLNTDGHIISSILGRSQVIPVVDGAAALGEFGRVYFGDLDAVRERRRTVRIHIMGD